MQRATANVPGRSRADTDVEPCLLTSVDTGRRLKHVSFASVWAVNEDYTRVGHEWLPAIRACMPRAVDLAQLVASARVPCCGRRRNPIRWGQPVPPSGLWGLLTKPGSMGIQMGNNKCSAKTTHEPPDLAFVFEQLIL